MRLTYFCNLSCTTTRAGFTAMLGGSIASSGSFRLSECLTILMYVHDLVSRSFFSQKRTVIITNFLYSELLVQPYRETVICPSAREPRGTPATSYLQRYADHARDVCIPCCHDSYLCHCVVRIGINPVCRIMDQFCIHVLG